MKLYSYTLIILLISLSSFASTDDNVFSDETLTQDIKLPSWFKLSFLDLKDDIIDAQNDNKKGLILYFGRKDCPYCKALIENNWQQGDTTHYTRKNFDVVAIDTKGIKSITDFDGFVYDEKQYSLNMNTNFTPSLLFYNLQEKLILRLSGYQQPYRLMAALEYVADNHYKDQSFSSYLSQAETAADLSGNNDLNSQSYFADPPFNLNRKQFKAGSPLAVFFEKKHCHACDILHSHPLQNKSINNAFEHLDVIQLDRQSEQPIITPKGVKTTTAEWANQLDIHYSPTIIFFDESGKEIIRIDSVVWAKRLGRVLEYIQSSSYKEYPSFLDWRNK